MAASSERGGVAPTVVFLFHARSLSPRVAGQVRALAAAGLRVVLCWCAGDPPAPSAAPAPGVCDIPIHAGGGGSRLARLLGLPLVYWQTWRALAGSSFAAVQSSHLAYLPLALLLGRRAGAKVIYDDFDLYPMMMTESLPGGVRHAARFVLECCERAWVRRVDLAFVIDTAGDYLLHRFQKLAPRVIALSNFVAREDQAAAPAALVSEGARVLVYGGGIADYKGATCMVEALHLVRQRFADVRLLVAGEFKNAAERARFEESCRASGVSDAVDVIDAVPYREFLGMLRGGYAGLALYQLTPRYLLARGNTRKIFCYMSAGLPVICPAFGEIGQVVEAERCGIRVDTADASAVAAAMLGLLSDPDAARAMGARGWRAVHERLNWEVEMEKYVGAYRELLGCGAGAPAARAEPGTHLGTAGR